MAIPTIKEGQKPPAIVKVALLLAADRRMRVSGYGISPCPTEPTIVRKHIDGPYISTLDGQIYWLSPWERLLTKLGIWNAWHIELRRFPLPRAHCHGIAKRREA